MWRLFSLCSCLNRVTFPGPGSSCIMPCTCIKNIKPGHVVFFLAHIGQMDSRFILCHRHVGHVANMPRPIGGTLQIITYIAELKKIVKTSYQILGMLAPPFWPICELRASSGRFSMAFGSLESWFDQDHRLVFAPRQFSSLLPFHALL